MISSLPNWGLWAVTIGSSALIALLAFAATAGWSELSVRSVRVELESAEQQRQKRGRRAIIQALATELIVNRAQLRKPALAQSASTDLSKYVVYPVLQSDAISAAISSEVFTMAEDTKFLSTLFFLVAAINVYNNGSRLAQERLNMHTTIADEVVSRQRIHDTRLAWNSSRGIATLKASLRDLEGYLDAENVNWDEAGLVLGPEVMSLMDITAEDE